MNDILQKNNVKSVRLVTDIRDAVTHPNALKSAMEAGWDIRVVNDPLGTFHPKLYVGADSFDDLLGVSGLVLAIVGSANLSKKGFSVNGECSFFSAAPHSRATAGIAWKNLWNLGNKLSEDILSDYEIYFAKRNRKRTPEDFWALGVTDTVPKLVQGKPEKKTRPPKSPNKAVSERAASIAWAGVQSFTGAYTLQIEFPKEAGLVLKRIIGTFGINGVVEMLCNDGQNHKFKFRYYDHNGMFRLNVPHSVPLVDWVRDNKDGIAVVEALSDQKGLHFEFQKPGAKVNLFINRSLALGTWGRTSTRVYGWL